MTKLDLMFIMFDVLDIRLLEYIFKKKTNFFKRKPASAKQTRKTNVRTKYINSHDKNKLWTKILQTQSNKNIL